MIIGTEIGPIGGVEKCTTILMAISIIVVVVVVVVRIFGPSSSGTVVVVMLRMIDHHTNIINLFVCRMNTTMMTVIGRSSCSGSGDG